MKDRNETWSGDSALGRRIWRRYAAAPGLISTAGALQMADRLTGTGRLPLLVDVQRRWMPHGEIWPHGGSPLRYVQPAYAEPALPTPDVGATVHSVSSGVRVVQREALPSASTAGKLVGERRAPLLPARSAEQPVSDESATVLAVDTDGLGAAIVQRYRETPVGKTAQTQVASSEPMRLSEPVEPSSAQARRDRGESAGATGHPLVKLTSGLVSESRPSPVRAASATSVSKRASASEGELSAETVQRYQEAPIRRVSRTPAADSTGLSSRSLVEPTPSAAQEQSVGPSIVQHHLETPIRQVSRTPLTLASGAGARMQRASAEPRSVVPGLSPVVPSSHSIGKPRLEDAQAVPVAAAVGGDLGAAIVQRYEGTPMKQSSPATIAAAGKARLSESVELVSRADAQVQRASTELGSVVSDRPLAMPPSRPAGEPGPVEAHAVPATAGDLGAAIVQRHLDGPVGRVVSVQRVVSGTAGDQGTAQADPLKASGVGGDLGATILQRHLGGLVGRAGERQQLTVVSGLSRAAPREAAGLSRSARSVRRASDPGVQRWGASAFEQNMSPRTASLNVEMPLAEKVGGGNAPPVQPRSTAPGARPTIVQRAMADAAVAPGASAATSVPASPSAAPSGAEGPDLERLADEVYAIIERRLIIERESRGL